MDTTLPALSLMTELRSLLDDRLSANEDYRALRALEKAILEVKIVAQLASEQADRTRRAGLSATNPVGDAQQNLSMRLGS